MTNVNFFNRDTSIKASDNPLYDNLLSGGESWLSLRYSNYGFTGYLRMDAFHNSNLKIPTQPTSGFGIGAWSINKDFEKLSITGGYIYDQIGSGIIFRAYEDRGLLIDNALVGLRLKYELTDKISVKAFTGQQKNMFERYNPIVKGINVEGSFSVKDKVFFNPGIGAINRTLDKNSMDAVITRINALPENERKEPKYNMYAATAYNALTAGNFSWYVEGAYKSQEAFNNYNGNIEVNNGTLFYTNMSYALKGLAANLTAKRTQNFVMRTSPSEAANLGMVNWQPIVAQIRPQRLIARYTPQSLDWSEMALNGNILYSPNDEYDFNVSYTHINTIQKLKLYREAYFETNIRSIKDVRLQLGVHYMQYNQEYYQFKPGYALVKAITPFMEFAYKLSPKRSITVQAQYMDTKQDFGSWAFLQLEYALAPKWSFAISDMYNVKPAHSESKAQHYYNAFVAYTQGAHRFSAAWVKQVEGINCTGGVCRYEPAFNGLRVMITSSF
ncbi:hypothetical protein DBR32_05950 [Taibaiella sp. KBW10]|nr:hypothetical protein DBR32_05950 [Taibaiella sp. KBW10]